MFCYYKGKETLQLDPPIIFGCQHSCNTQCGDYFVNICNFKHSRTRKYFCCSASTHWNSIHSTASLPSTLTCPILINYAKSYVIISVRFVAMYPACIYVLFSY